MTDFEITIRENKRDGWREEILQTDKFCDFEEQLNAIFEKHGADSVGSYRAIYTANGKANRIKCEGALRDVLTYILALSTEKDKGGDKSGLDNFKARWYASNSPTVWCEIYQHPLHRVCPVVLNYETLSVPLKGLAILNEHEGKTGDTVHLTPETCFKCPKLITNGGVCDPV